MDRLKVLVILLFTTKAPSYPASKWYLQLLHHSQLAPQTKSGHLQKNQSFKMAPLSLYEITIPPFIKQLQMISAILEKGQAHSAGNEAAILEARLVEDMQPLIYQSKLSRFSFISQIGIFSRV